MGGRRSSTLWHSVLGRQFDFPARIPFFESLIGAGGSCLAQLGAPFLTSRVASARIYYTILHLQKGWACTDAISGYLLGGFRVPVELFSTATTTAFTSSGMLALVNRTSAGGSGTGRVSSSAMTASVNQ